jgi:hypothetical protein
VQRPSPVAQGARAGERSWAPRPGAPPKKECKNRYRFDLGTCFDSAHCSRHASQSAHETPALMPPASARKASASRHRPASGFCKHWRASTAPGRARAATAGTFRRRVTFCCGQAPTVGRGDAGSLTRCFAAPNPWTTDLPKPILAACVQGCSPPPSLSVRVAPRCASACARSSPVCRCPVSQSVCRPASHSAGLIRPGGFAVSTVAATPLH